MSDLENSTLSDNNSKYKGLESFIDTYFENTPV